MTATRYLMDDPRESRRLAAKVDATTRVDRYVFPILGSSTSTISQGCRLVVDVGCGPGTLLDTIIQTYPDVPGRRHRYQL